MATFKKYGDKIVQKLHLLFNHALTQEQENDAVVSLGVDKFVSLPPQLQALWSNVPPELESLSDYLQPIKDFLAQNSKEGDFVLVQGDFGAAFLMAEFANSCGLVAVYATTKRDSIEKIQNGVVTKESVFKHVRFRKYEKV